MTYLGGLDIEDARLCIGYAARDGIALASVAFQIPDA